MCSKVFRTQFGKLMRLSLLVCAAAQCTPLISVRVRFHSIESWTIRPFFCVVRHESFHAAVFHTLISFVEPFALIGGKKSRRLEPEEYAHKNSTTKTNDTHTHTTRAVIKDNPSARNASSGLQNHTHAHQIESNIFHISICASKAKRCVINQMYTFITNVYVCARKSMKISRRLRYDDMYYVCVCSIDLYLKRSDIVLLRSTFFCLRWSIYPKVKEFVAFFYCLDDIGSSPVRPTANLSFLPQSVICLLWRKA